MRSAILATLLLAAPVALAAPQAPPAPDVVVEGERLSRDEARATAAVLVREATVLPEIGQYARWHRPICAKVVGIDPKYGAMIVDRIRAAADEAGARVETRECRPNLAVVFSLNGKNLANLLLRRAPAGRFAGMRPQEQRAFAEMDGPVRWLYRLTATDSQLTTPAAAQDTLSLPGRGGAGLALMFDAMGTQRYSSSLIDTNLMVLIDAAMIIVDMNEAKGVALDSIGNYVARVALAQTRAPARAGAELSILGLFERPDAKTRAIELTAWDRAYLKALYSIEPNRSAQFQRARLQNEMITALATER